MVWRAVTSALGLVLALAVLLRLTVLTSVVMNTNAMEPTLNAGEFLAVTRGDAAAYPRGAVVLLRAPSGPRVARIAALAGDRLDYVGGQLRINERPHEPLVQAPNPEPEPTIVPPAHVFVLNDHLDHLEDSRAWGVVPVDRVDGRVRLIWLSLDWFDASGEPRGVPAVRWPRLFGLVR